MGHLISKGGNAQSGHELFVSENKQLTQPLMNQTGSNLGVSATNMKDVSAGALGGLDFQGAMNLLEKITPQSKPVDKNMLGLLYFTDLAKRASEPGATLFGSAAGALQSPTAYLVKRREEERKRKAAMPAQALTLATALGKTGTLKNYEITSPEGAKQTKLLDSKQAINLQNQGFILNEVKSPSPAKPFNIQITNEDQFSKIFPNTTIPDDKIISVTADQFALLPQGAAKLFDKPPQGAQFERTVATVNEIGQRLAAGEEVSPAELAEYSIKYQKLVSGGKYTKFEDGKEIEVQLPGIDLSGTNLPIPEGIDLDKILSEKAQKFDQTQVQAAAFGSRMLFNEGVLRNVIAQGYVLTPADVAQIKGMSSLGLGMIGVDPLAQQFHVAAQNWVAAQLRRESGAAIAASEYSDALLQYFPVVGDSKETLDQKRSLRETATKGMIQSSGMDAFKSIYPAAVPFLTYTSGEETYEILDPQGYANKKLQDTAKGKDLFFKDTIAGLTTEELKNLLKKPNADKIYSAQQLTFIGQEIDRREK
jgi:hypothetical protein